MSQVSMSKRKEYYRKNVSPIIQVMMADILKEMPEDITAFMKTWVDTNASKIEHEVRNRKSRRPEGLDSSSEDEEDEIDLDQLKKGKKTGGANGRASVSAEVFGMWNKKKAFEPKVIPKDDELKARINARLQNSFMFQALEDKERTIVMDAMEEKIFESGETVIKQGDDGDVLYVVDQGVLKCEKIFPGDDKTTFLKNYEPGESFGELALLYNAPRAATIIASERSVLYSLDRSTFNNIVKDAAVRKRERYIDFLNKVKLLDELDEYEKTKICDCLQSQKFKPGDYVIREGESGDTFFMIEEGEAYATKRNSKGEEQKVLEYDTNSYFGELALLKDQPRAASVIARTPLNVAWIDRNAFKRLLGPLESMLARNEAKYAEEMKKVGFQH